MDVWGPPHAFYHFISIGQNDFNEFVIVKFLFSGAYQVFGKKKMDAV
jgi:hypothetical protein